MLRPKKVRVQENRDVAWPENLARDSLGWRVPGRTVKRLVRLDRPVAARAVATTTITVHGGVAR